MSGNLGLHPVRRSRYLFLVASIMTFLLIVMGGIVRVTESGLGCPDWPLCYGRLLPPLRPDAIIEYTHRLVASLTTPLILASALAAWWRFRTIRLVIRPMIIAVGLLILEIALGAVTVLTKVPPVIVAVHLGVALAVLAMLLMATVTAFLLLRIDSVAPIFDLADPFFRLALGALAVTFVVLVSGAFVAGSGATTACTGWPLCNGSLIPASRMGWIHMIHRLIVGAASVLILLMVVQAWRTRRNHATIFPAATVGAAFFFAQAFVGALKTTRGFPPSLLALHVATAVATWAALVVLVVLAGLDHQTVGEGVREAGSISLNRRLRDLLVLTRPLVVLLLLVTAFAGMVVGARTWPAAGLVFWTLLGGGLAAGGAQAVNQYVDRDMDALMTRTARRPIPAGRLTPAEGLAWGLFLCISSLYILVGFVSWLAAFLTLVGMVYYVLVYTLLLKRTSAQNIVIGGGAGAMAPVVGLAAAAGGLNVWALFLFAIVFLWTPPHFWALAIVKLKDYARANVPMMPVVRGERFTRGQIMLYALGLVLVSVLPPVFALAGPVYLISSILLGGILLYAAWTVWAKGGVNLAWRLYRISSLYLAFLFVALMVDVLH